MTDRRDALCAAINAKLARGENASPAEIDELVSLLTDAELRELLPVAMTVLGKRRALAILGS